MIVLECSWARGARVTDISESGCYVESRNVPTVGADVDFTVQYDGIPLALRGTVVHCKQGIGFAIAFPAGDADHDARVRLFVKKAQGG